MLRWYRYAMVQYEYATPVAADHGERRADTCDTSHLYWEFWYRDEFSPARVDFPTCRVTTVTPCGRANEITHIGHCLAMWPSSTRGTV